jgi:hypothetical protein
MNIIAIDAQPNPEFLIKSISEQGYSLETALSDLIDNAISAKADKIEILTEHLFDKTSVFITDNGRGMSKKELSANMQFPSRDMESERGINDLGRFGLGMKTASFSQTRKFTVISREKGTKEYSALSWDVFHLKKTGKWEIIMNTKEEIQTIIDRYIKTSDNHLEKHENYDPNTIVIWDGLKNFNNYLDLDKHIKHLNEELTATTSEYLSVVFHKFMEFSNNPLKIRLNNILVKPFNPFTATTGELARVLEPREMSLGKDVLKMKGFVLPVTASDSSNIWTPTNKSLLDMEGIYIYRGNRIIFFGGWNGIIRKQTKLKLARLKIQVGNTNDEKLQLNVAKSKISIPYELRMGVLRYISELKTDAIKEYNNRGLKSSKGKDSNIENQLSLLQKKSTTKGPIYSINQEYPLVKIISDELNSDASKYFKTLLKGINILLNKQRYTDNNYVDLIQDGISLDDVIATTKKLLDTGLSEDIIYNVFLKDAGIQKNNLPEELKNMLQKK